MSFLRQHLIDPEICIRCNTCEETCPVDAITHNDDNYVVDAEKCNSCMACISPCPTGSIDNWRVVKKIEAYSIDEQFTWEELPEESYSDSDLEQQGFDANEQDASDILQLAHSGQGQVKAPSTAAHPYINVYDRNNPIEATVAGNYRITGTNTESDIHHIVLDFGQNKFPVLEGQSIGVIPPGEDAKGRPHLVRLYSIASPRDGEKPNTNNLSLTVKRVRFEEDGSEVVGVGSNYVCDLKKGDKVKVTGPFGATFLMPMHKEANIIMICTGTGSAPFRAMTEYRRRHMPDAEGELLLYFGARTPEELPYFGPLNKLSERFIDKQLVYSRLPGTPKEYVQSRMLNNAEKLSRLLALDETYIYICGLKDMENGVEAAFEEICAQQGMAWADIKARMKTSGHYHVETY